MTSANRSLHLAAVFAATLTLASGSFAQSGAASGAAAASSANRTIGRDTSPLNQENALEVIKPPEPKEEKAYKAFKSFQALPNTDMAHKTQAGEDFIKKYPSTSYTSYVYGFLTIAYIQTGALDKATDAGDKDLQLNPHDVHTMAALSQALARLYRPGTPNGEAQLAKADDYGKRAIAMVPTLTKPEGVDDAKFEASKNSVLAMAYSGTGLVLLHKQDYAGAVPLLEKAIELGDNSDSTNYYLLGVASLNSNQAQKAAAAFEKCAAVQGNLQQTCSAGLAEAKQRAK